MKHNYQKGKISRLRAESASYQAEIFNTITKKLLTIFTLSPLSPKLTNSENGENVRFVLFFGIICEIRKTTLLPLDDLLKIVNAIGMKISRNALDRTLRRNGISNLREMISSFDEKAQKEIKDKKDAKTSSEFLKNVIDYFPFKIEKLLTDNGGEFTNKSHYKYQEQNEKIEQNNKENENKKTITSKPHLFDLICQKHNIEHRLTKPYTPQTNGMVERFNKKIQKKMF